MSTTTTTTQNPNVLKKHILSLEVPATNNMKVFRVQDTSQYSSLLDIDCSRLTITSPGFSQPRVIDVMPGFNLVLNACTLGLQQVGCSENSYPLPDGIYIINYSVAPNDKVYVEYNHLRTTQMENLLFKQIAKLELSACEPSADIKVQLKELRMIKDFIDAAKVKVEYANEPEKGMELLLYAQKLLDKYSNNYC